MAGKLVLEQVRVRNNTVEYQYTVTKELQPFFCQENLFCVSYDLDGQPLVIENVPQGVLAIPFVCNVLPIIWLIDAELVVPELDQDFYESIPEFKKGYVDMHRDASFLGKITVQKVTLNRPNQSGRSAAFFSGGVDAWCTLTRHIEEKPDLIAIWGADIAPDNREGWEILHTALAESARKVHLPLITIHSTFRRFLQEGKLETTFFPVLHDGWWHAVQHGIGLIGHAAPCNYLRGVSTQYIAASFSTEDGLVSCASWPTIDNYVKYCGCRTIHDAFITRQAKVHQIVQYKQKEGAEVRLHVCWKTTGGKNCGQCEKCIRTMMALLIEGADPREYGFDALPDFLYVKRFIREEFPFDAILKPLWKQLQGAMKENGAMLRQKPYYNDIKWIEKFDFDHPERYWKRRVHAAAQLPRRVARNVKGKLRAVLRRG